MSDQDVINFLSKNEPSEHYYYLQDVTMESKLCLMYALMNELGYGKFVSKTLADEYKLRDFKL